MVTLDRVSRHYRTPNGLVRALDEISLEVNAGELVVIRGPSGSGKTTLLLAAGGMLHPTSGRVIAAGQDIYRLGERRRAAFRAAHVGFVFQMYHLIPYLDVLENVQLARGRGCGGARARALELLEQLGLTHRIRHRPSELSAGERQRVAVARAMLNAPGLILADEPTGNLDEENARQINQHLAAFCHAGGTVLMATHGSGADAHAHRIVRLRDGRVEGVAQT